MIRNALCLHRGATTYCDPDALAAGTTGMFLFVNGDSAEAMAAWQATRDANPGTIALVITGTPANHPTAHTLQRPLEFSRVGAALDAIVPAHLPRPPPLLATRVLRILIADRSPPSRHFLRFKLEELAGTDTHIAIDLVECGEHAIARAMTDTYDLALLDAALPGIDSYETCRQLKAIRPLRVALLGSRSTTAEFSKGRAAGCDNYLPKPPADIDLRTILRLAQLTKPGHGF